jgi:dihydrofolate synthase / folylpolyglutamate synthase
MSYESAVAQMYALGHELAQTPSHKFDLIHMRVLLEALGNPQRRFPGVLLAGTNGKGSTAATLSAILQAVPLRTGLYTSPHLVQINERIRVNGEPIADDAFALLHNVVERTAERLVSEGDLPWHPSFFEMLTAMAFEYFARENIAIAVLEVGMGGRLDATNVIEPVVSVITDISLDHQKFLGNTVTEIAREKAGIIHPGGVVVTLPQSPQANDVIGSATLEQNARAVSAVPYVPPLSPAAARTECRGKAALSARSEPGDSVLLSRYPLEVLGKEIMVESPLVGRHQLRNIALAIRAAEELKNKGFPLSADAIERGVRETRWPGRFQVIPAKGDWPEIVLDVAHNPAGAWALRAALSAYYGERLFTIVFGAMRDKAISEISEILFPLSARVIATQAENPRSASPDEIRTAAQRTGTEILEADSVSSALHKARQFARTAELIVVTGSIYVVGEAMRELEVRI